MTKLNASRLSLTASVIALTAAFGTPAFAQSTSTPPITPATPPDQPSAPACAQPTGSPNDVCTSGEVETESGQPATANNANAIIVTGTRIKRPNLESPVPITSISQEELTNQGQVSVGDALNDLPALRSTFSQQNSGRFIGTAGQNFLDLRGLGTNRTLVLVDGRRFVTGSPGSFDVDVDDIPQDLIDRVDVVTGGESAVYGSDAVAGVVNFILKKNYDGFTIRGQGGESKYGDRPVDFISTTIGKNFADGRGNIAFNAEYTHAGELYFRDRAHASRVCTFEPNPADNRGRNDPLVGGDRTNGIPDNIFVCGVRSPGITVGGALGAFNSGQTLGFDPSGNLVRSSLPTRNFTTVVINGKTVSLGGGIQSNDPLGGITGRETGDLAVGQNRYAGSVIGHFDVSDLFKPFVQATFVRQKAFQEFQPTFFEGDLHTFFEGSFGASTVPSLTCSNGFLTAQALATLQGFGFCSKPNAVTGLSSGIIPINRFNVDMGARKEQDIRTTYRIVGGFTGDFKNDWHYEVSFNYGHTHQDNQQHNDLFVMNPDGTPGPFSLALDAVAVKNGVIVAPGTPGSTVECRSTLTDPNNGCVPLNLFGEGGPSQAAVHYVNRTSDLYQTATEQDALAFLSGDTQQWFSLPGGPIGFSVGLEHRRETAESHADPISAVPGGTFFNAFPEFNPPAYVVNEAFGEINVPILKDRRFVHELTVSGAARYSHYNLGIGNTFTWNANAIWAPTRDLRLRANYSKSVRTPTLGDLFTPPSVNFAFVTDPCDEFNINTNPNFAANCAAAGVPTTVNSTASPCFSATPDPANFKGPIGSPFHNCIADRFTLNVQDQGNPGLKPETGKSLTVGGVFTPRFIPGFSLSVDYFDIKIEKVITGLGANTVVNLCFSQPTIQNQFCPFIFPRDQFGLFASPAVIETSFNFAKRTARGLDFDLNYRRTFANGNRLSLRGIATYMLERNNFEDILHPKFGNRILSELGDPVFSGTLITGYGFGKFDFQYTMRYIGSMTDTAYENTHPFAPGCSPVSGLCPPFNSDILDHPNTGSVFYHDIRGTYTIHNYQFYAGVDNIFNRLPPLGLTGSGSGSGIYSNIGRFFYAGAVLTFK